MVFRASRSFLFLLFFIPIPAYAMGRWDLFHLFAGLSEQQRKKLVDDYLYSVRQAGGGDFSVTNSAATIQHEPQEIAIEPSEQIVERLPGVTKRSSFFKYYKTEKAPRGVAVFYTRSGNILGSLEMPGGVDDQTIIAFLEKKLDNKIPITIAQFRRAYGYLVGYTQLGAMVSLEELFYPDKWCEEKQCYPALEAQGLARFLHEIQLVHCCSAYNESTQQLFMSIKERIKKRTLKLGHNR